MNKNKWTILIIIFVIVILIFGVYSIQKNIISSKIEKSLNNLKSMSNYTMSITTKISDNIQSNITTEVGGNNITKDTGTSNGANITNYNLIENNKMTTYMQNSVSNTWLKREMAINNLQNSSKMTNHIKLFEGENKYIEIKSNIAGEKKYKVVSKNSNNILGNIYLNGNDVSGIEYIKGDSTIYVKIYNINKTTVIIPENIKKDAKDMPLIKPGTDHITDDVNTQIDVNKQDGITDSGSNKNDNKTNDLNTPTNSGVDTNNNKNTKADVNKQGEITDSGSNKNDNKTNNTVKINELNTKKANFQKEKANLESNLANKKINLAQIQSQITAKNNDIRNRITSGNPYTAEEISAIQSQIRNWQTQITTLNQEISNLNSQITQKDQQIISIEQQISALK
ncbi:MAG: hypothetical protein PHR25_03710 [Clostridia bacterium]|nr:hypothetical protein [Clostridia bacterium]